MSTNLSTPQLISYSVIGFVIAGILGTSVYYSKKYANDPKDNIGDDIGIFIRNHSIGSVSSGLSRRKKSHTKRKQSRRRK